MNFVAIKELRENKMTKGNQNSEVYIKHSKANKD